jgi:hypothetical protein
MNSVRIVQGDLFYCDWEGFEPRVRQSPRNDNEAAHPSGGRASEIFYECNEIQYPRE